MTEGGSRGGRKVIGGFGLIYFYDTLPGVRLELRMRIWETFLPIVP